MEPVRAKRRKRKIIMQYMLLIYENEQIGAKMSKAEGDKFMQEYFAFTNDIKDKKNFVAGEALQPVSTATTVRVRDGKTVTTDGPFAETREQLGGFYLVEAKDLDEARSIAARIPSARHGSIEVRPVVKFS
jgi:hypothetical protein